MSHNEFKFGRAYIDRYYGSGTFGVTGFSPMEPNSDYNPCSEQIGTTSNFVMGVDPAVSGNSFTIVRRINGGRWQDDL